MLIEREITIDPLVVQAISDKSPQEIYDVVIEKAKKAILDAIEAEKLFKIMILENKDEALTPVTKVKVALQAYHPDT